MNWLNPKYYPKAILAALAAAQVAFIAGTSENSEAGTAMSANEWTLLTFGALIAGIAVYTVSNGDEDGAAK